MSEAEFQIVKSLGFVAALAAATVLQRLRPHAGEGGSWRTNGALWAVDAAVVGLVCAGCACAASRWAATTGLGLFNAAPAPAWLAIPITLVALDLVSYLWHRANHRVDLLWRFHQVHHSDPHFTVTTALRFHPGELLMALPVRLLAVVALGASIPAVIVFELVFAVANFVEHGDVDLPRRLEARLARVLVTPALHRRHHARARRLQDGNYGTILSVWDRGLGTFGASSSAARIAVGLPGLPARPGTLDMLLMPGRVHRGEAAPDEP